MGATPKFKLLQPAVLAPLDQIHVQTGAIVTDGTVDSLGVFLLMCDLVASQCRAIGPRHVSFISTSEGKIRLP